MSTAISIKNITKKYGNRTVLNNISFETATGEVFGLLGPNGAGKTTLIKLITGLINIEEGEITIFGSSLEKDYENAMQNLGAIVENPEMYKYMTGMQNIRQYARMRKGITSERIDEVVNMVGLSNRINEKICKYSLGMRQRLGLALALLHNPKILILDEPTNGLDPAGIKQLRDIITNIAHTKNVCVIVSSHLMSEMELMCDRIAIINNGVLIKIDNMENILSSMSGDCIRYRYKVSDTAKASGLISEFNADVKINVEDGNYIQVDMPISDNTQVSASIISLLVSNKIDVYSAVPMENQKLEDAFIEITNQEGGNQIV